MVCSDQVTESFEEFKGRINLLLVIDHSGRAGNGFFQTIFDSSFDVISCPWVHYVYSYIVTDYGQCDELNRDVFIESWPQSRYFSLIYGDIDASQAGLIRKMGGDPEAQIDRKILRSTYSSILKDRDFITRKDMVCATYYSYAKAMGRNTDTIKYILCTDQISLRNENVLDGFSGRIVDSAINDFPNIKIIHLERDPRAAFASTNHQFINQLGNMYGLRVGHFGKRLARLRRRDFDWDSVFIFGFWLIYFYQTYKAIMRKRADYPEHFLTVRNEDLNLNFVPTMHKLAGELGIERLDVWTDNFTPTMLGKPWTGTGAYNSQYQTHRYGPLRNDPDHVARSVSGPNAYVTQRWRSRLKPTEIMLVEALLADEIEHFGYDFLHWKEGGRTYGKLRSALWWPLKGELPTLHWILDGLRVSRRDFIDRLFYLFAFPIFYIQSRLTFLAIVKEGRIFELSEQ